MIDERKEKIRTLIANLTASFSTRNVATWLKRNPDLSEDFWKVWADLDSACLEYLTWEPVTWESVLEVAREVYCIPQPIS